MWSGTSLGSSVAADGPATGNFKILSTSPRPGWRAAGTPGCLAPAPASTALQACWQPSARTGGPLQATRQPPASPGNPRGNRLGRAARDCKPPTRVVRPVASQRSRRRSPGAGKPARTPAAGPTAPGRRRCAADATSRGENWFMPAPWSATLPELLPTARGWRRRPGKSAAVQRPAASDRRARAGNSPGNCAGNTSNRRRATTDDEPPVSTTPAPTGEPSNGRSPTRLGTAHGELSQQDAHQVDAHVVHGVVRAAVAAVAPRPWCPVRVRRPAERGPAEARIIAAIGSSPTRSTSPGY